MNIEKMWHWFREVNPWRGMMLSMILFVLYGVYALGDPVAAVRVILFVVPLGLILDYALHHSHPTARKGKFPESGLITSLIVTVLMPLGVAPLIAFMSVALAILSKHFIRFKGEHVFNPASFGVVITSLFAPFALGWWPDGYIWLAIILGVINLWRTRKYFQMLAFALIYLVFLAFAFKGLSVNVLLALPFFFMAFMLPEPVTSEGGVRGQIQFGVIAAGGAVIATFIPALAPVALPAGLMLANLSRFTWKNPAPKYALTQGFSPQ